MESQITCKELSLGYDGRVISEEINLSINKGDYLCIVGENGSGKSTLMKTMLGLKEPLSGKVTLGDGLNSNEIGYLPQQTAIQKDFPASVKEIVLSGCLNRCGIRPFYSKVEKRIARDNIAKLGIENLSSRCYRELSGGQQQRVLLARALSASQKLLMLDEPVSGLDPKSTNEMYEIISELNRREGLTVVMVSHDISMAVKYATHIFHAGRKPLFFGKKSEYINSDAGKAFLSSSVLSGGEGNE